MPVQHHSPTAASGGKASAMSRTWPTDLVGAVLMGVGGVVAMGCMIGQGISGVSTLSLGSLLALAAIVAGALLALRYQTWRIESMV